jgi:hypothetical protein
MENLIIPLMTDAYMQMLRAGPLGQEVAVPGAAFPPAVILDGPSPSDRSSCGLSVGASVEDPSGEWAFEQSVIDGPSRQLFTLRCLAWASSGETVWQGMRNRCSEIVRLAEATLAEDRTMNETVSTAFMVGGLFNQQMADNGSIVVCEFRIDAVRF